MSVGPGVVIGLSAVVVAIRDGEAVILTVRNPGGETALPFGPFDPQGHRTFELAMRAFVTEQTRFNLGYVEQALTPHYGADCPAIIVYRATWPDEEIIVTTLSEMKARVREEKITRTALIFVGRVFGDVKFRDSRLYAPDFAHVLRNAGKKKARAAE